jgi:hypothetical protein
MKTRRAAQKRYRQKRDEKFILAEVDPKIVGTTCWAGVKLRDAAGNILYDENGEAQTKRCPNNPIKGQRTCVFHGGHSAGAVRRGLERNAIASAKASLVRLGISIQGDPREVLLAQVYAAYGMMLGAQQLVQTIEKPEDVFEETEQGLRYQAYLTLYESWVDRAAKIAKMALDADIDERMVHLAEGQAKAMVETLKLVVLHEALKLSPEQAELALQLLGNALRTYVPTQFQPGNVGQPAVDTTGGVYPYTRGNKELISL